MYACVVRPIGLALLLLAGCGRVGFDVAASVDSNLADAVDARRDTSSACAAAICEDPDFGSNGRVTIDVNNVDNAAYASQGIAVEPNDSIVFVGKAGQPSNYNYMVGRLTSSGASDLTFGIAGIIQFDAGSIAEELNAVAIDPQRRIVVAGIAGGTTSQSAAFARLLPSGDLDPGLSIRLPPIGTTNTAAFNGVGIDVDNNIVLAGQGRYLDSAIDIVAARRLDDGSVDTTFGLQPQVGYTRFDVAASDQFGTFGGFGPLETIYGIGDTYVSSQRGFAGVVFRAQPNGVRDNGFGLDGAVVFDPSTGDDRLNAMVQDSQNRIVAVGAAGAADQDFVITRLTSAGVTDTSFGSSGTTTINRMINDQLRSIVMLPDGRSIVGGFATNGTSGYGDVWLFVISATGAVQHEFQIDVGGPGQLHAMTLDQHGRLVILASVQNATTDLVVARMLLN